MCVCVCLLESKSLASSSNTNTTAHKGGSLDYRTLLCGDRTERHKRGFSSPYLGFENADFETLNTTSARETEKKRDKKKGQKKGAFIISRL